jgi:hypothetical protein
MTRLPPRASHRRVFLHFSEWYSAVADAVDEVTVSAKDNEITIPRPPYRKPIFVVAWFHTHPPPKPGWVKVGVGPSTKYEKTSRETGLPGAVPAFLVPGTRDCTKSGTFFFGNPRRPPL